MPYVTPAEMLMTSIVKGQLQLVKILLRGGTDVNSCLLDGRTALMICCSIHKSDRSKSYEANLIQILEILLKFGANVNIVDNKNRSCLMYACSNGYSLKFIDILLNHGADTTLRDKSGLNCVDYARKESNTFITKYLHSRTGEMGDLQYQENRSSNKKKAIFSFSSRVNYPKDRFTTTNAYLKYKVPDDDCQSLSDENKFHCIPSDPPASPSNVSFVFEPQFNFEKKFDTIEEIGGEDIHEKEKFALESMNTIPAPEKENALSVKDSKEEVESQINESCRTNENINAIEHLNRQNIVANNRLNRPFGSNNPTAFYDSTNHLVESRTVVFENTNIKKGKENTIFPNQNRRDILTEMGDFTTHTNNNNIMLRSEENLGIVKSRESKKTNEFDHQKRARKRQESYIQMVRSEHKEDIQRNGVRQRILQREKISNGYKDTANKQSKNREHQTLDVPNASSDKYWKHRFSSHAVYDVDNQQGDPSKRRDTFPTLYTYNKNIPKKSSKVVKLPPI